MYQGKNVVFLQNDKYFHKIGRRYANESGIPKFKILTSKICMEPQKTFNS